MKQKLIIELDVDPNSSRLVPDTQQKVRLQAMFGDVIKNIEDIVHRKWRFVAIHTGEESIPADVTLKTLLETPR